MAAQSLGDLYRCFHATSCTSFCANPEDAIAQKSGSEFIVRRAGTAAHASETSAKKGGEGIAHSVVKCEIDPPLVSFAFHRADIVTSFNSEEDIKL